MLKDSQELLQRLNSPKYEKLRNKVFLYSCDFESIYTNINPDDAIKKICKYLKNEKLIKAKHFDLVAFRLLLKIVFNNNIFKFEDLFYLQLIGLSMGCKCGPTVANLYLYIIEKTWVEKNKPLSYARFIDDIFCATEVQLNKNDLQSHFGYLKLNIADGEMVNFLDLTICQDPLTDKFITNLYTKPTNTFSYLKTNSNHPKHIFNNIP